MNILFKYSQIYEFSMTPKSRLKREVAARNIKVMDSYWKRNGNKIEKALREVTGLSFKDKSITCYLNSRLTFSDPLSLRIEKVEDMKDNLTHELIHVLLTQNFPKIKKKWEKFWLSLKKESFTTKVHVSVHAIHLLVARKITPKRIKRIISYSKHKEYRRAWDIVLEKKPEAIIDIIF